MAGQQQVSSLLICELDNLIGSLTISDIGLVSAAYIIWKLIKRTKWVNLRTVPLESILLEIEQTPEEDTSSKGKMKLISWMWD